MKIAHLASAAVAFAALAGFTPASAAGVIDFGFTAVGPSTVTHTGPDGIGDATSITLGNASFFVNTVGSDDTTGTAIGNGIKLGPTATPIVVNVGAGLEPTYLLNTWTANGYTYSATFNDVSATGGPAAKILTLDFYGDLVTSNPAFLPNTPVELIATYQQLSFGNKTVTNSVYTEYATSPAPELGHGLWAVLALGGLMFGAGRRLSA